jgi:molecular chaperone DnaJ
LSARSDPQGYYRVLGLSHTATADEIRLAFRARAMESHPDQAGDRADGETFRLIREAFEVLRDPRRLDVALF